MRDERSGLDILLDFIHILVVHKKLIIGFTALCTIIAIITVLVMDKTYRVVALVKPPASENASPMSSLLENAGPLSGLMGSFLGNQSGSSDCMSILGSSLFAQKVIEKFELIKVYKFNKKKTYHLSDVMKAFHKKFSFTLTDEDALRLSIEDKDMHRAAQMMEFMTQLLDSLYIDLQKRAVKQKLEFYNQRVELAQREMNVVEDSLAAFQKLHNLYMPELQVKSMLEMTGNLEMQIEVLSQEMDLESSLRGSSTPQFQKLSLQRQRLQKELKNRFAGRPDSSSLSVPIRGVPELALEYYRLERAYNIKFTIFKFLIQQVEMLKLEQAKTIRAVAVIDPPWEDDKRVAPKRGVIVELVFVASFIMASMAAALLTLLDRHRRDASPTYSRLLAIRQGLLNR